MKIKFFILFILILLKIGQFNPTEDGLSKLMNCENSVRNSVTHTSTAAKTEISLEWQSPVDFEGEIVFK